MINRNQDTNLTGFNLSNVESIHMTYEHDLSVLNLIQELPILPSRERNNLEYLKRTTAWYNDIIKHLKEAKEYQNRRIYALIPQRFKDKSFETFIEHCPEAEKNKKDCIRYVENFNEYSLKGHNLIMIGNVGTGKTHLAYSINKAIIQRYGVDVNYQYMLDIFDKIKSTYGKNKEDQYYQSEEKILHELINAPLLILDEVGVQYFSEYEKLMSYKILNGRYLNQKPTVMITNCKEAELTKIMGERVVSRLSENAGVITFTFADQRGKFK